MILFEEFLKENLVLLDGAMGSLIYEKGVFIDKCYDELNLSRPELIRSIHEEYIMAGANVIESNTYGANRFKLKSHNLLEQMGEINRKGVELARSAAGEKAYVAGSMGPSGQEMEPWGEISLDDVFKAYAEQAAFLQEEGVALPPEIVQLGVELHDVVVPSLHSNIIFDFLSCASVIIFDC